MSSSRHVNNVVNVAAGNDYGIAPEADIVFVRSSGGSSDALCNATITLYNMLRSFRNPINNLYYKPWVANYSIATISEENNGGSRLGVSPISKVINDIQTFLPNYPRSIGAFFVGSGNFKVNTSSVPGPLTQSGYTGSIISNTSNPQQFGGTKDIRYAICKTNNSNNLCPSNIANIHQSQINLHLYYPPESEVQFQLIKNGQILPSATTYFSSSIPAPQIALTGANVLVTHRNSIANSCTFTANNPPSIPAVGQCEPDNFFNIQIAADASGSQLPSGEQFTGEWKIRLKTRATSNYFNDSFKYIVVESNNAVITGGIGGHNYGYFIDYTDETASLSELAATRNVIAVGSTTSGGDHSAFSSIGPTRGHNVLLPPVEKPDIFAVGEDIPYLSTCKVNNTIVGPCNGQPCETITNCSYGSAQGTSFSTPFAAGTAALLISLHDYNYESFYAWDDILSELKRVNFSYPNTEESVSNSPGSSRYLRINALKSVAGKLIRQGDLVFQPNGSNTDLSAALYSNIYTNKKMYVFPGKTTGMTNAVSMPDNSQIINSGVLNITQPLTMPLVNNKIENRQGTITIRNALNLPNYPLNNTTEAILNDRGTINFTSAFTLPTNARIFNQGTLDANGTFSNGIMNISNFSTFTFGQNARIYNQGQINVSNANLVCSPNAEIINQFGGRTKYTNGNNSINCNKACLMAESSGVVSVEGGQLTISNEAFIAAKGGIYDIAPNAKLLVEASAGMPMLDPNSIFKVAEGGEFINHKSTDFPTGNIVELNGGKYIVAAGTSTFKLGSKLKFNSGTLEIRAGAKVVLEGDNAIEMLGNGTIQVLPGGNLEITGINQIPSGKNLFLNGGGNVVMGNYKWIEVFGGLSVTNLNMTAFNQWNGFWFRPGSVGGVNSSTLTKLGAGAYAGALWIQSSSPEFINNTLETVNCAPHCFVFDIGGSSSNPLIRNNIITSNGGDGIYVREGAKSILLDNTITVTRATASAYLQTSTAWNSWYWGSGYGGKNKLMGGQNGIYLVQGVLDASGYGAQNHLCGHSGMDVVATYPSMVLGSNNRWENGIPKISGNVSAYPIAGTTNACSAVAKTDETVKTDNIITDLQQIIATWQEGKQALAAANLRSLIKENPERSDVSAALWALAEFHSILAEEANLALLRGLAQRFGLLQRDARQALSLAYKNVKEYDKALLALRGNNGFSANVLRFELYKETGNFELARKMLNNGMNPQDVTQAQLLDLFSHELEVYEEEAIKRGLNLLSIAVLDEELPEVLSVSAYPNPLKEEGLIRYELPVGTQVSLKIYDALGRLVAIVKDEFVEAGVYEAKWQVNGASNGIYFYRFEANEEVMTGKMVVMK